MEHVARAHRILGLHLEGRQPEEPLPVQAHTALLPKGEHHSLRPHSHQLGTLILQLIQGLPPAVGEQLVENKFRADKVINLRNHAAQSLGIRIRVNEDLNALFPGDGHRFPGQGRGIRDKQIPGALQVGPVYLRLC